MGGKSCSTVGMHTLLVRKFWNSGSMHSADFQENVFVDLIVLISMGVFLACSFFSFGDVAAFMKLRNGTT